VDIKIQAINKKHRSAEFADKPYVFDKELSWTSRRLF